MQDKPRTLIAVISDTHIGSHTALALPEYKTDDGPTITASDAQKWLLKNWTDYWDWVKLRAGIVGKKRQHRLVVIHLGDIVDGIHHENTQSMPNLVDQEGMACELLRPLANLADAGLYILRGTEAHAGQAAQSEVRIAREIGARACEWEMDLEVDSLLLNFAHHARGGSRDWTSSAANMASEIVIDRAVTGQPIPRLVFRGHRHCIDDSGAKLPALRLVVCPSWQLKTAFGWKVAPGKRSDIGGLLIDGESVDFSHARYTAAPGQVARYKA